MPATVQAQRAPGLRVADGETVASLSVIELIELIMQFTVVDTCRCVCVCVRVCVLMCRNENWFYAEVDTLPSGQIDFVLTYEQLLRRRLGTYQLCLPLGHLVFF